MARPGSPLTTGRFGQLASFLPDCPSTQDIVRAAAANGAPEGFVAIADHQSLNTEAPTQETGSIPRVPERERQRAFARLPQIAAEFRLSPPQVYALRLLEPEQPLPMGRLACALG